MTWIEELLHRARMVAEHLSESVPGDRTISASFTLHWQRVGYQYGGFLICVHEFKSR